MGRKRSEMRVGAIDNITEQCPKSRHRFALWAREELAIWLLMRAQQHMRVRDSCEQAAREKAGRGLMEQASYHNTAAAVIGSLIDGINDHWDSKFWWDAVEVMEQAKRDAAAGPEKPTEPPPF